MTLDARIRMAFPAPAGGRARGEATSSGAAFTLDVEFNAPVGVTILFGASGAGKSQTLRAIAGLARPDEGLIAVGGEVFFDSTRGVNLPIRLRRVGYLFQDLALFPHMTVLENVEFGGGPEPPRAPREGARPARTVRRRPRGGTTTPCSLGR